MAIAHRDGSRLEEGITRLLDEQRVAVGALADERPQPLRQNRGAGDAPDQVLGFRLIHRIQANRRAILDRPEVESVARAVRDYQQHATRWHEAKQVLQRRLRGGVAPVPVFDHQYHWLRFGDQGDDRDQRVLEGASQRLALEVRRQGVAAGNRQQMEQEGQLRLE